MKDSYFLQKGRIEDIPYFIEMKLESIFLYAEDLSEKEKQQIVAYVKKHVKKDFCFYQKICMEKNLIGMLVIRPYEDGFLLDELFLKSSFRHQGIGTDILKNVLNQYSKPIYLWVYQNNTDAFHLYRKFGFQIKEITETRYFMVYF